MSQEQEEVSIIINAVSIAARGRSAALMRVGFPRGPCIRPLRIIHAAPKPATLPSFHRFPWGHWHDTIALFLRTWAHCSRGALPPALRAGPKCRRPAPADHAIAAV